MLQQTELTLSYRERSNDDYCQLNLVMLCSRYSAIFSSPYILV